MTDPNNQLLDPGVLAAIDRLQLRAHRIVEGYVSGMHRSSHHGFSHEFAEHRQYSPGDDLRHIDWKVFARTDKYYLKRFEEETNLVSYLLLDTSRSMTYQSDAAAMSKLDYARTAAAALAYLVLGQQDTVSLATYDDRVRTMLRPTGGRSHLREVMRVLENIDISTNDAGNASGNTQSVESPDMLTLDDSGSSPAYHELAERLRRRGIVVVLSDLIDDPDPLLSSMRHFLHRRHELVLMHVQDPFEIDFPFDRTMSFRDLETSARVTVDPRIVRDAYRNEVASHVRKIRSFCSANKADYVELRTDQPLASVLASYLAVRSRRVTNE